MRITPELLERYHLGDCTDQEVRAVEAWLKNTEDEESSLSEKDLDVMSNRIWQSLSSDIPKNSSTTYPWKRTFHYGIAACLTALGVFSFIYWNTCAWNTPDQPMAFNNPDVQRVEYVQTALFGLALLGKSNVVGASNDCKATASITFSGHGKIRNLADRPITLQIAAYNVGSEGVTSLVLKPNRTCALYTATNGKKYVIPNNSRFSVSPTEWQRYNWLFAKV